MPGNKSNSYSKGSCEERNATGGREDMGTVPDSKVHGTNMGIIWGQQDPGGPHVGPMNFAIWGGPMRIVTKKLSEFHLH